jgi:hypothetical protein
VILILRRKGLAQAGWPHRPRNSPPRKLRPKNLHPVKTFLRRR